MKRGTRTDGAVHAWAVGLARADVLWAIFGPLLRVIAAVVGRRTERVDLPLSPGAWASLRAGLRWAAVVAGVAAGALLLGLLRGDAGLLVLGSILLVAAWFVRALVLWRRWVGVVLRPGGSEVVLTRVSPEFAQSAKAIFVESVSAQPRR